MAELDYRAIAERFREAWSRRDAKGLIELFTEDATHWEPTMPEPARGRKLLEEQAGSMMRAFPDISVELANLIGAGNHMAAEWVFRGTHTGPLEISPGQTVPPTGRRVEIWISEIFRLNAEGLIAEHKTYFDSANMMQQLGLGRQPEGTS